MISVAEMNKSLDEMADLATTVLQTCAEFTEQGEDTEDMLLPVLQPQMVARLSLAQLMKHRLKCVYGDVLY